MRAASRMRGGRREWLFERNNDTDIHLTLLSDVARMSQRPRVLQRLLICYTRTSSTAVPTASEEGRLDQESEDMAVVSREADQGSSDFLADRAL